MQKAQKLDRICVRHFRRKTDRAIESPSMCLFFCFIVCEDELQKNIEKSVSLFDSPFLPTHFCFTLGLRGQPKTHFVAEGGQKFIFITASPYVIDRKGSVGAKQERRDLRFKGPVF